jgi:hypothetical protein
VSIYNDQINTGNFWTRKTNKDIESLTETFSAIIAKYEVINKPFYEDLINNSVLNFDIFYDILFLETETGYIVEKFYYENDKIYPYNNNNFFTSAKSTSTKYWFDEYNLKLYFFDILFQEQNIDSLEFIFYMKEFDCKTGLMFLILQEKFYLKLNRSSNWGRRIPVIESPVVSFSDYTNTFNVSFLFRNNNLNICLMSLMIENKKEIEITKINAFIPFASVDMENSYQISL